MNRRSVCILMWREKEMMNDEKQSYGFTPCSECGGQRVVAKYTPTMGVYFSSDDFVLSPFDGTCLYSLRIEQRSQTRSTQRRSRGKQMSDQTQRPLPKPCPECGGERTFTKYNKQYLNREIKLVQPSSAYGFLMDMNSSPLDALTCLSCGYTTFYAARPDKLRPYKYTK